jgi:hypothetical protein
MCGRNGVGDGVRLVDNRNKKWVIEKLSTQSTSGLWIANLIFCFGLCFRWWQIEGKNALYVSVLCSSIGLLDLHCAGNVMMGRCEFK